MLPNLINPKMLCLDSSSSDITAVVHFWSDKSYMIHYQLFFSYVIPKDLCCFFYFFMTCLNETYQVILFLILKSFQFCWVVSLFSCPVHFLFRKKWKLAHHKYFFFISVSFKFASAHIYVNSMRDRKIFRHVL